MDMPLYLNELAPWERKNEYYHIVQLGKDVREQTSIINDQTKAMIASQIASADAVIASQERISEGIDTVVCGVERVEEGISGLEAAFEWGISEVVWQIEQNRAILKNILEVLMAPLDTQARERKKRAEEAYANAWIDDAEEEFLESEKLNKFDFSIHISLGMLYLFHKIDKIKSLSYFEKAIKYSKPKSAFITSYALLHKALIHFDMGNTEQAEKSTDEAISLSPTFSEALYQNAQYNAQLQNANKSIQNLEKAIRSDKIYCLKANNDEMFDPIRDRVTNLFEKLRDEEKTKSQDFFLQLVTKHNKLKPIVIDISKENFIDVSSWLTKERELETALSIISTKSGQNSYFDFLEINNDMAPHFRKDQDKLILELKEKCTSIIYDRHNRITIEENKHRENLMKYSGRLFVTICLGSFAVPVIMSLIALEGWERLWSVAFCIPIFSQCLSILVLYRFITDYSGAPPGWLVVAWSLVIYLIACIGYYVMGVSTSLKLMYHARHGRAEITSNRWH